MDDNLYRVYATNHEIFDDFIQRTGVTYHRIFPHDSPYIQLIWRQEDEEGGFYRSLDMSTGLDTHTGEHLSIMASAGVTQKGKPTLIVEAAKAGIFRIQLNSYQGPIIDSQKLSDTLEKAYQHLLALKPEDADREIDDVRLDYFRLADKLRESS